MLAVQQIQIRAEELWLPPHGTKRLDFSLCPDVIQGLSGYLQTTSGGHNNFMIHILIDLKEYNIDSIRIRKIQ